MPAVLSSCFLLFGRIFGYLSGRIELSFITLDIMDPQN